MPSPSTTLQRPDLGATFEEISVEAQRMGYIADQVLPAIDVAEPSANIGKLPIEALMADRDLTRAPGGGYSRQDYQFTEFSYATQEYGAEEVVDDRLLRVYARYFDAEQVAARRALTVLLRKREMRVAAALFNATTWASYLSTLTNEWDDLSNASPVDDLLAIQETVILRCGLKPNALIVNEKVFHNLRHCEQIVDRLKYAGIDDPKMPVAAAAQIMAQLFGLDKVIVAGGLKNTANAPNAFTGGRIWSNEYAMLARVAMTNDVQEPCVGRTFHYTADGSQLDGTFESYREDKVRGDVIRARHETAEKIMYVEAAQLIDNVTT